MSSMTQYKKPFEGLSNSRVPSHFTARLNERIAVYEKRRFIVRMTSYVTLSIASVSALVASCVYVWNAIMTSGFGQYASLVFTDGSALAFSKELGLTLVESLPVFGVILVLVTVLSSLWALSKLVRQSKGDARVGAVFA